MGFIHSKEQTLKNFFLETIDRLCDSANDIVSTIHFIIHCTNFTTQRQTLMKKIHSINSSISTDIETSNTATLLLEKLDFKNPFKGKIILAAFSFTTETGRFNGPLF